MKKRVAFHKNNWYIKNTKWITNRTKVHVGHIRICFGK